MFISFIAFVIEHELHHLIARAENLHLTGHVGEKFEQLWLIIEKDVAPCTQATLDKKVFRALFEDHQEEILADVRAMNRVMAFGRGVRTFSPSIDGALLFFHIADIMRWTYLRVADADRLRIENGLDGVWLSIAPILYGESHPYPLARRAGVYAAIRLQAPTLGDIIHDREKRFLGIFNAVRRTIIARFEDAQAQFKPDAKWGMAYRALFAS